MVLGMLGLSCLNSLYTGERDKSTGPISRGVGGGELLAQSTPVDLGATIIPAPMAETEPPDKPPSLVCKEQRTVDPISSKVKDEDT